MPMYTVWYKETPDGRAPEYPPVNQYALSGQIKASSKKAVQAILSRPKPEVPLMKDMVRQFTIGDILMDEHDIAWILTAFGQWSIVTFDPNAARD